MVLVMYSKGNPSYNATDQGNYSCLDQAQFNNAGQLNVSGWHASNQSADKPYQWLIFVDQEGHERYRQQVLDINNPRPDLAQNRSYILGAGRAGFKLAFAIPQAIQHHSVRVIHRLTNDPQGNGNYVGWWSGPVDINAYQQRLISQWQQVANRFANPVSIAIQVAQTGEVVTLPTCLDKALRRQVRSRSGFLTSCFITGEITCRPTSKG
jgi:hypothetical protein